MKDAISHHQNDIGASLAMELTNANSTFYEYKWSKLERNTIAGMPIKSIYYYHSKF